jgi:hypothetical protein
MERRTMSTLRIAAGTAEPIITTTPQSTASAVDAAALITEQQVLFASAAALAPAPVEHHRHVAHDLAVAVRAMFARHERSDADRHYPRRLSYLENSAMSREMYRL